MLRDGGGVGGVVLGGGDGDDGEGNDLGGCDVDILGFVGGGCVRVGLLLTRLILLLLAGLVFLLLSRLIPLLRLLLWFRNFRVGFRSRIGNLSSRVEHVFGIGRGLGYTGSLINRLGDGNSDRDVSRLGSTALVAVLDSRSEARRILLGCRHTSWLVIDKSMGSRNGGVTSGADVNIGRGVSLGDMGIFLCLCWDSWRSCRVGSLGAVFIIALSRT